MSDVEDKLIEEFGFMFPGYRLQRSDDEGYKLLRDHAIETETGKEAVWIATVYDMAELFMLFELNRKIVNDRTESHEL